MGTAAKSCKVALRYEFRLFAFNPQSPLRYLWKDGGYYAFPAKRISSVKLLPMISSRIILGFLNFPFLALISSSLFQRRGTECPKSQFCTRCKIFRRSRS